jgi:thiamine-monophosphate kinase
MNAEDSALGEFELIRRYFLRHPMAGARDAVPRTNASDARSRVILGIGDDAAVLALPPDTELVAAVDTIVEGRHFPPGTEPRSIGHRALAVNLSDMAAMGATPAWATLALAMPAVDAAWLEEFAAGFFDLAAAHGVELVGGDTVRGPLTLSVQILGYVPGGTALRRSGARAGDLLAVTGTLGDAAAGLALVLGGGADSAPAADDTSAGSPSAAPPAIAPRWAVRELIRRFDYPEARVQFGAAARGIATAAMDLSDGLAGDLPKLARASGLAAHLDVGRLPLSAALRAAVSIERAREWATTGGDDYELLLAVPPARYAGLEEAAARLNLTLTSVGELSAGSGVTWSLNGEDFTPRSSGFDHFGRGTTQITV